MATAGTRPSSVALEGRFQVFDGEDGQIDNVRRIEHPDGRVSFIIEYAGVDERWELRVDSPDGRSFRGAMRSPDWEIEYTVSLELWQAPGGEQEWLLLGAYEHDDEGRVDWAITLWADEPE
jgi:hypothetical protein